MLYRVDIKYTTRATAVVEADDEESAKSMFHTGNWDDLFGEDMCDWEIIGTVEEDE